MCEEEEMAIFVYHHPQEDDDNTFLHILGEDDGEDKILLCTRLVVALAACYTLTQKPCQHLMLFASHSLVST